MNEAGITVVVHAGDSGYSTQGYAEGGFSSKMTGVKERSRPTIKAFNIERAAHDWLITMSLDRMYTRFPNLRIASVENGSDYLAPMFRKLRQQREKTPRWFGEDPVEFLELLRAAEPPTGPGSDDDRPCPHGRNRISGIHPGGERRATGRPRTSSSR